MSGDQYKKKFLTKNLHIEQKYTYYNIIEHNTMM